MFWTQPVLLGPPYIIRKYIPEEVMIHEERYWVINNNAYHRSGIIPDVVKTAVERLKQLNAPYYVIDATPDFIVEINPGVSSDPYPDNIQIAKHIQQHPSVGAFYLCNLYRLSQNHFSSIGKNGFVVGDFIGGRSYEAAPKVIPCGLH